MSDWFEGLDTTLGMVWSQIEAAGTRAPARFAVFASVGRDAGAEARMVVLRGSDRQRAEVCFYTDLLSCKVGDLAQNPAATLLLWLPELEFQIRLRVRAQVQSGAQVAHLWPDIPPASRRAYGGTPPPGTPIDAPADHDPTIDPARLAVVVCGIDQIDTVCLTGPRHHRALFLRADGFGGQWLAP